MASYTWKNGASGDWTTAANWLGGIAPINDPAADVLIDAKAPAGGSYEVTIGKNETITVSKLSVNPVTNKEGTNVDPYNAAKLQVDGTLAFATGSAGLLDGPLQTFIGMSDGSKMVNVGTINGFIQTSGDVLFTGTNGFYVTNWLQSLGGVATIDTPIAELQGTVLFDGIFEAKGPDSAIRLGGSLTNTIVNIGTIIGPTAPGLEDGWTEVIWNDATSNILQWNGTSYVSLETSLKEIGSRGTVDVLESRNYTTTNSLSVLSGGMLNLAAGTVTSGGLNINGGIVQGHALISSNAVNNGTMTAIGGTLAVTGTLTGNGVINFDRDNKPFGTLAAGGSTVELHAVAAGQTIVMDGNDRLVLDSPTAFLGSIQAAVGDKLVLTGLTPTSASVSGGNLVITGAGGTLASLKLIGDYSAENFVVNGSTLTVAAGAPTPTPTPTPSPTPAPVSSNQLLLQNNDGSVAAWQMSGTTVSSFGIVGNPGPDWFLKGTGAFYTGDTADYVWQNSDGQVAIWQVQGTNVLQGGVIANPGSDWHVKGTGNFYNDGHSDIVWQNDNGLVALWGMDGSTVTRADVLANPGADWHVKGTGNFYGNGGADTLWQNDNGQVAVWDMNGSTIAQVGVVDGNAGPAWQIKGTGDFYGNGTSDVLLQNSNGQVAIWDMTGSTISQIGVVAQNPGSSWHVMGTADVNGDGKSDITLQNDDGSVAVWQMNGSTITSGGWVANPSSSWNLLGSADMRFVASTGADEVLTASPVVAEQFDFTNFAAGNHTIAGFSTTQDMVELSAAQFASFAEVQAATSGALGGALINLGNSSALFLQGVDPNSLHASNFALA